MYLKFTQALVVVVALAGPLAVASAAQTAPLDDKAFEQAVALFEAKSYDAAREGFEDFRTAAAEADQRAAPRYVEAYFYEAECLYLGGDKYGAHQVYEHILRNHKNFPRIADVISREYEIGSAFIEGKAERPFLVFDMQSESLGAEILQALIDGYQQKYFDYAQYQVADYHFRNRDWRRAADAYLAVEENFKESPWAGVAQYQRALCYLGLSRGYRYDQTPVIKAEEVLLDYVKKNPTGSRIREAEAKLDEIRSSRAKLYAENARFYLDREDRPRAALVYVQALLRETPDAPAAAVAPALLEEVAAAAGDKDPGTSSLARELLADLDRKRAAPPAPAIAPPPAATLVPGSAGSGGK